MAMACPQVLEFSKPMFSATATWHLPPAALSASTTLYTLSPIHLRCRIKYSFLAIVKDSPRPAKEPNWLVLTKRSGLEGATKEESISRYLKIVALIVVSGSNRRPVMEPVTDPPVPSAVMEPATDPPVPSVVQFRFQRFRESALKSVEKKLGIMLNKWKTIKKVYLQVFNNCMKGISNHHLLADKLIPLSPDLTCLNNANKVMYLPSNPNRPSYNTLVKCSINKFDKIVASAYNRMHNADNISPNTLAFLLKSFASSNQLESGKTVHGQVIKLGFVADTFVMNSLLDFYIHFLKNDLTYKDIRRVFEDMPERDIDSWNIMISFLVVRRLYYEAFLVFDDMLSSEDHHRCKPNETTLINMLKACSGYEGYLEQGKWLGAYIKENKFALSLPLGNALLEMFVGFRDLGNAKMVFNSMSKRCILTWEIMFSGLVENGFCKEAVMLFDTMCCCCSEEGGLKPNDVIFTLLLIAFKDDVRLVGDGKRLFSVIHKIVHGFGVKPNDNHYHIMVMIIATAGFVEAAMMLVESLPLNSNQYAWAYVLYECQIHRSGDDLLLDSWIRKIDVADVKTSARQRQPYYWRLTMKYYIFQVFLRKPNNDVNHARTMVNLLLRKLSDHSDLNLLLDDLKYFYKYLDEMVEKDTGPEESGITCNYSAIHAQEMLLSYEDDVYKVVESLHGQMINNIDDPCQLAAAYF
ncbi:hypothetical protein CASFOL_003942 [Castilleja foliolosa]|uniref:Pentatricopeptide repeat-containing protein n=1 Tax=Castilleja foliolosa TaxID=1961234 RepID=A0ABD3EJ15_9LAMI